MRFPWTRAATADTPETNFLLVRDANAVRAVFANQSHEPAILFIHDPSCGISARALREMSRVGGDVHIILTGDGQHLSALVEQETGVRHESPQVFVLQQGRARWTASHYRIRRGAVLDATAGLRDPRA